MVKQEEGLGISVEKYLRRFYKESLSLDQVNNMHAFVVEEVEKRLISVTLEATQGNRLKTAKILGINRNTLLRKIRQFKLEG